MTDILDNIKQSLTIMAECIEQDQDPTNEEYLLFIQNPELITHVIEIMGQMNDAQMDNDRAYYSACLFTLDICVAELQAKSENGNKSADKILLSLMKNLAKLINKQQHSLSFWLPVLNAFYEVHVELSAELKNAYFDLANHPDESISLDETSHVDSIRNLLHELENLSVFDIAENFFAQSHAMPADFFADFVMDLYSLDEGKDIAILALLHPNIEVRQVVMMALDYLLSNSKINSVSLSRLQSIKYWYPSSYHAMFDRWIKHQRKQGVVFMREQKTNIVRIEASEVDGSGAQGIFIHLEHKKLHRLCGLLFKQKAGIKDAWITPNISLDDVAHYYGEAFDDSLLLREVNIDYVIMMTNHFLAITIENHGIPDLHLLSMQEALGIHFKPQKLDVHTLITQIGVEISPFTPDILQAALKRSNSWATSKPFTLSWFVENTQIDKLVNRYCNFQDGLKLCRFNEAMQAVFIDFLEPNRADWIFHFLWVAMWSRVKARSNEKFWQDSFLVAYAIHEGMPLMEIPIMQKICHRTVVNSIETMHDRKSYLS